MMKKRTIGKAAAFLCALVMLFAVPFCAAAQDLPRETESANTVQVSTVDEFLAAIAPDTEIVLAPGEYNLTQAAGYGRIGGTIIGSIIMGILINGLVLMNVSAYYQQIITGLIIVLAVAFDTYAKSRRGAL